LADRIVVPTTVLWPEHDPLFPPAWSDRLADFFAAVRLHHLDGVGHVTPVEAPHAFAAAVTAAATGITGEAPAAGETLRAPVESVPLGEVERLFRLNTVGALRVARAVLPGMRERGAGAVRLQHGRGPGRSARWAP
jgi:NAD(P)-dependent dehydrogenase (short-subunit alcohol dehydrogenase family)